MRIVLFAAGGEIPAHALQALRAVGTVVAVVRPTGHAGIAAGMRRVARRIVRGPRPLDELDQLLRTYSLPVWPMRDRDDPSLAARLRSAAVDLSCIATFPWPLDESVIGAPRLGTVNLHASLLPRHRGPNPWFWTYHADDREAGVTAHVCTSRVDRGPILAQARWPLARGHSVAMLHREVAERGAALLPEIVSAAARGSWDAEDQDETHATRAPRVRLGARMVDPTWPVERTWHFLSGLVGRYVEPLLCEGAAVPYTAVTGFERGVAGGSPGSVVRSQGRDGWVLWCTDGAVHLSGSTG